MNVSYQRDGFVRDIRIKIVGLSEMLGLVSLDLNSDY